MHCSSKSCTFFSSSSVMKSSADDSLKEGGEKKRLVTGGTVTPESKPISLSLLHLTTDYTWRGKWAAFVHRTRWRSSWTHSVRSPSRHRRACASGSTSAWGPWWCGWRWWAAAEAPAARERSWSAGNAGTSTPDWRWTSPRRTCCCGDRRRTKKEWVKNRNDVIRTFFFCFFSKGDQLFSWGLEKHTRTNMNVTAETNKYNAIPAANQPCLPLFGNYPDNRGIIQYINVSLAR